MVIKKDDQITMTFEGPDNEEDVETQINTIDAVIAENPDVLCISASDMDSCEAQLEAAKENGIPVIAFDSNVAEKKLVKAYRGKPGIEIGAGRKDGCLSAWQCTREDGKGCGFFRTAEDKECSGSCRRIYE